MSTEFFTAMPSKPPKTRKGRRETVDTGLMKAKIILVMKNGVILHGDGRFEGIKSADNMAYITAYFTHPLSSLPSKSKTRPKK